MGTAPRTPRDGAVVPPSRWDQRVPGPQVPGLVSGITLVLGLWLVLAPFAWTYGNPDGGVDARWNDVLVGLAIAAVSAVRITRSMRLAPISALSAVLGGWLVIAPFVLEYGYGADSTNAIVNDVVVGAIVAGMAALGYLDARDPASAGR